jgi:dynein heavy chain, axonemal
LDTHQEYLDQIQSLPHITHPNVFGFHANADITKDINETNQLLESVLLCSSESGGGQGGSQEELLERLIQSILGDFPEAYDVPAIMEKYPVSYKESMNTVLTQELQRFNGLIKILRSSLKDLKLAMLGKIVMNASL